MPNDTNASFLWLHVPITIVSNPVLDPTKHLDFYSNKKQNLIMRLDKNKA